MDIVLILEREAKNMFKKKFKEKTMFESMRNVGLDRRLTLEAKGVYTALMKLADNNYDYRDIIAILKAQSPDTDEVIKAAVDDLARHGYLQMRNEIVLYDRPYAKLD